MHHKIKYFTQNVSKPIPNSLLSHNHPIKVFFKKLIQTYKRTYKKQLENGKQLLFSPRVVKNSLRRLKKKIKFGDSIQIGNSLYIALKSLSGLRIYNINSSQPLNSNHFAEIVLELNQRGEIEHNTLHLLQGNVSKSKLEVVMTSTESLTQPIVNL